jgi:predicted transcriptional regulator
MDITPYVDRLREDLSHAAATTDEATRGAADRLALALDPSSRLVLMEALSQAAAEITTELPSGAVEVRLVGRELEFVVEQTALPEPPAPPVPPGPPSADAEDVTDGATARITLRLPENVKTRAEELAARSGHSLNTWIVNALRDATREHAVRVDIDLSSVPFADGFPGGRKRGTRRMSGWA